MVHNSAWKEKSQNTLNYSPNFIMLKQSNYEARTLFLKLFTRELILSSKSQVTQVIIEKPAEEIEKVNEAPEKKEIESSETFLPSILEPIKPEIEKLRAPAVLKPLIKKSVVPIQQFQKPPVQHLGFQPASASKLPRFTMPVSTAPRVEKELDLGKLNLFLADTAVTEIECPGPEKFIIVKKAGQVNLTKVVLSQEEITNIIDSFSNQARIPLLSGVFKASVGDLTITAIISEFVGSRFILYKSSPYSIIEHQARQINQAQLLGKLLYLQRKNTPYSRQTAP